MTTRRIVLVDDEEALAWSLSSRLARAYPTYRVVTANDGESALALIGDEPIDLLIADIRMPGMSGIDLVLAVRNKMPKVPVIVMTAFKSVDITSIHAGPFTGFLEKPFEFEKLRDQVDEALTVRQPQKGFSGAIMVQGLPDIVQLYVLSSATGLLSVKNGSVEGRVYFAHGAILHAYTPANIGDEAFHEIMMWSTGEFSMRTGATSSERSVHSNWQELLMESVRRIDEERRNADPNRAVKSGWTHRPPPSSPDIDAFDDPFFDFAPDPPLPVPARTPVITEPKRELPMNIKDSLAKLNQIDGFVGAALVDSESGMLLGQEGGGPLNLEVAAAGNTEVVRAKRKTMNNLALKDGIEDILITLGKAYHLIRPLRARNTLFFYVALDRQRANLAMARIALADVEKELQV